MVKGSGYRSGEETDRDVREMESVAMRTYRDLYPNREQWDDPAWFDTCADLSEGETDEHNPEGCQQMDGDGIFICTRPANHEGPHVADTGYEVVAVWD